MGKSYIVMVAKETAFRKVAKLLNENKYCKKAFAESVHEEDFSLVYDPLIRAEYRIVGISWKGNGKEEKKYYTSDLVTTVSWDVDYVSISNWKRDDRFSNFKNEMTWIVHTDELAKYEKYDTDDYEETDADAKAAKELIEKKHHGILYHDSDGYHGAAFSEAEKYLRSKRLFTTKFYNTISPSVEYRDEIVFAPFWTCVKNGKTIKIDACSGEIISLEYEETEELIRLQRSAKREDGCVFFGVFMLSLAHFAFNAYFLVYAFADLMYDPSDKAVPVLIGIILGILGFFLVFCLPWIGLPPFRGTRTSELNSIIFCMFKSESESERKKYQELYPTVDSIKAGYQGLARLDDKEHFRTPLICFLVSLGAILIGLLLVVVTNKGLGFMEHVERIFTFDWSHFEM